MISKVNEAILVACLAAFGAICHILCGDGDKVFGIALTVLAAICYVLIWMEISKNTKKIDAIMETIKKGEKDGTEI